MNLMDILNSYTTPLRVIACSKRWWTPEVKAKRKGYSQTRWLYKYGRASRFTLKATRISYYYTVRKTKHKCWKEFLQGAEELQGGSATNVQNLQGGQSPRNTERC